MITRETKISIAKGLMLISSSYALGPIYYFWGSNLVADIAYEYNLRWLYSIAPIIILVLIVLGCRAGLRKILEW